MHDALGRVVPKRLDGVFRGRRTLLLWTQRVNVLRKKFRALEDEPYAREVDFEKVAHHLQMARRLVMEAAPFGECDCRYEIKDCPKCGGTRWITASHSRAPKASVLPRG